MSDNKHAPSPQRDLDAAQPQDAATNGHPRYVAANGRSRDAALHAGPADGKVGCSMASVLLRRIRTLRGEEGVDQLLQMAGVRYTPSYLDDVGNWIWYDETIALFEAAVQLTGDSAIARRIGEDTVRQHAGTPVATLLRSLGSPEAVLQQVATAVTKFTTVTNMEALEVTPGHALVRAQARGGFARHPHLCALTQGVLSQPTVLFGLQPAKVEETSCELRGDDCCLYEISWDAEAALNMSDPHALVAALESQLAAMKDRLESMYLTARDLIASDDVNAALARVTERAATAVRAPKYLLAVRLDYSDRVYVHHRGFADEDPEATAAALLAGQIGPGDDSRLVAEVASARRHYGWLMAISKSHAFFAQERDQLEVYARYAAAVLDMATALDDASWRADHDPLTDLYNRRRLTAELERLLAHATRYQHSGALLMLDLDNFKLVNDSYGHAAGDRVLKSVAKGLADRARETDVVARLGGDEFAVLLPEANLAQALAVAENLRDLIHEAQPELPMAIGASIGVAVFEPDHRLGIDEVMAAADSALYTAKEQGKNCIEVYSGQARATLAWVGRIQEALREDRFVLYAQPLIDLRGGQIAHHELLLRMVSVDGEIIAPGEFLPAAEQFGLVGEIDRWVVARGLAIALAGEAVAINLSGQSIGDQEILRVVRAAIDEGLDPANVIFELKEAAAVTNPSAAESFIATLSELGCVVSVDDFGTGIGSLAHLKRFPARYLKIEMEFVRDLLDNEVDRHVVKAIVDIAHALGKLTVAEGVEDEATLEAIRECGVDYAQGFHLGIPEPLASVELQAARRKSA
jgi:diguanylate cyclase (GGDEF)-like protein